MNVDSFQDRDYVIPCQAYAKNQPSIGQARQELTKQAKYWPSIGQTLAKQIRINHLFPFSNFKNLKL